MTSLQEMVGISPIISQLSILVQTMKKDLIHVKVKVYWTWTQTIGINRRIHVMYIYSSHKPSQSKSYGFAI